MDARLTDEQEAWRDTLARLAGDLAMTAPDETLADDDASRWARVLELGVPALRSRELSGMDQTGVEVALAAEQFGRRLVPLPLLGGGLIAPELLAAAGATDALEQVAAGTLRVAPVLDPALARFAVAGEPGVAWDAAGATHALALERSSGDRRVCLVPLDEPHVTGLDITRRHVQIPPRDAEVGAVARLGAPIDDDRWKRVEALTLTVLAADLVGIMDGALADAVDHVASRHQFGVAVGTFQAVQHLAADCLVAIEGARSCCWHAAWAVDATDANSADDALLSARTAKAYASRAGRHVVEATVQMFGGVAITWEYLSHVRARRALTDRRVLGDESVQYAAIAETRLARAMAG